MEYLILRILVIYFIRINCETPYKTEKKIRHMTSLRTPTRLLNKNIYLCSLIAECTNIAEFANMAEIVCQKTFGYIGSLYNTKACSLTSSWKLSQITIKQGGFGNLIMKYDIIHYALGDIDYFDTMGTAKINCVSFICRYNLYLFITVLLRSLLCVVT